MKVEIMPYERRAHLLRILADHGPLSIKGVSAFVNPPMTRRRIRDALKRTYKAGLISKRNDRIFGGAAIYYQVSREPKAREEVASILKVHPDTIRTQCPRHQELLHWESCAILTELLRRLFPDAEVLRDFQLGSHPRALNLLLARKYELDLRPDMFILFPASQGFAQTSVAVEYERTQKSDKRLREKLTTYASETRVDGMVYICESDTISQRLMMLYRSKVLERSPRIRHYGANFFMLTSVGLRGTDGKFLVVNAEGKYVDLVRWIQLLRTTPSASRRDLGLQLSASGG